ncbi:MAG: hypothetical protein HF967_08715 [Methanosarcinales archaeon]|nr:hypothetical protein [Methanosarcinales archaeon]
MGIKYLKKLNGKTADEWFNIALNEKDLNKQVKFYSNHLKLNLSNINALNNKGFAFFSLEK